MKPLGCAAVRRKLHAFHDRELIVADQIAVSAHLDWCDSCSAALCELEEIGSALRTAAPGRLPASVLSCDEAAALAGTVVNRVKVEREASFLARVQALFEDMHLVYVGLGATAASVVCLVVALGMMRFGATERPDSLAAMVNFLAPPGSNANPVVIDAGIMMPRALDGAFSSVSTAQEGYLGADQDAVYALSAVVTREGTVANLELLDGHGRTSTDDGREAAPNGSATKAVEGLLDAVSRARFEPARREGLPVAVNMVWVVAHTTVRATKPEGLPASRSPVGKKRVADRGIRHSRSLSA